jgi:hypothetical protein
LALAELDAARQCCDGDLERLSEATGGANARAPTLLLEPAD